MSQCALTQARSPREEMAKSRPARTTIPEYISQPRSDVFIAHYVAFGYPRNGAAVVA